MLHNDASITHSPAPLTAVHRPDNPGADEASRDAPPRWMAAAEIALVFLVFAIQAAWPVPDPNEPYYLGKAKHRWNPDWAPGDFFFDSKDAHQVFFFAFGWPTSWLPLEAYAWGGRLLTWGLLAWAWRLLSRALVPRTGWAVLSAALFAGFGERCHMSGEWVIGGFEAKGLAYVLVFWALSAVVGGRWNKACLLLGAASALHVLVGGWCSVAAGFSWLVSGSKRPPLASIRPGLAGGLLLALPGLWPALVLNWGVKPQVMAEANQIYVHHRLSHHLSPRTFPPEYLARHALLFALWVGLAAATPIDDRQRRLRGLVAGAVSIALVGLAITAATWSHPALAAGLLRFYWFRLSDALLPAGVALTAIGYLHGCHSKTRLAIAIVLAGLHLGPFALVRPLPAIPRADKPGKVLDYVDWLDACRWAAARTPPDARFLTPRMSQTFKWYTGRSEVVSWKDSPQDARALVEWWRRMQEVHGAGSPAWAGPWHESLTALGADKLRRLGRKYDAGYVLTEAQPRLALPCLHRNNSYAIYELNP